MVKLIDDPMTDRLKNFKAEAESGLPAAEALASEMSTEMQTIATKYADALAELSTAWTSSDGAGTIANLSLVAQAVSVLNETATTDLTNIVNDVKTAKSKVEEIESAYAKAQTYKPGGYYQNGKILGVRIPDGYGNATDGIKYEPNDDAKIEQANKELPEKVKEAEKLLDAITDSASGVKLGIIGNMTSGGTLGTYTGYNNEYTGSQASTHHPTWWSSILSGLVGMLEGVLTRGEGALDGIVSAVTSLLPKLGIDSSWLSLIDGMAASDIITNFIDPLLENWDGYDANARRIGNSLGELGAIYGCSLLGPVGNIIYGLSVFGEEFTKQKAQGVDMSDFMNWTGPLYEGAKAGLLDATWWGRIILALQNTGVVSNVTSWIGDIAQSNGWTWLSDIMSMLGGTRAGDPDFDMCPSCHSYVPHGSTYCNSCGAAMASS